MLFAVDKYQIGTEREVTAEVFFGQYIANKKGRFFCPECGEQVFWRSRGGSHPDMFYHAKKTNTSPECDKRVDGNSGLYLYQRIGLPMFLRKIGSSWYLEIGFPALGKTLLEAASEKNTIVFISAGERTRCRGVDFSNFFPDRTTRIPIDIVPRGRDKYKISVQASGLGYKIQQKWSDYA